MSKNYLKLGFEFETEYRNIHINKGYYHEGKKFGKYWSAENDGSLRTTRFSDYGENGGTVELVSKILTVNTWKKAIKELQEKTGNKEFNEVFNPNESCGFHIHSSLTNVNMKILKTKILHHSLVRTRKKFFRLLENSGLRNELRQHILQHYFRDYAKKVYKNKYYDDLYFSRYVEWNFRKDYTIEWRSMNILGVKTWKELYTVLECAIKALKYLYYLINHKQTEYFNIKNIDVLEIESTIEVYDTIDFDDTIIIEDEEVI